MPDSFSELNLVYPSLSSFFLPRKGAQDRKKKQKNSRCHEHSSRGINERKNDVLLCSGELQEPPPVEGGNAVLFASPIVSEILSDGRARE